MALRSDQEQKGYESAAFNHGALRACRAPSGAVQEYRRLCVSQMHTMETPVTVQVILAVFNPNPQHLAAQIESVARQVGVAMRLHAVIADLASADLVLDLARVNDLAVDLHLPAKKLNAVAAFEFGLAEALESAGREDVFSLCDQDDVWAPDKLRRSCEALGARPGCHLVHTDARLVDGEGRQIARSMFAQEKRDRRTGLRRLLYRNSITGMTCVFSHEVAVHALPFPRQSGVFFYHDLWLGLVAAAKGPIVCLRDCTVAYRQHGNNAVGAVQRGGWVAPVVKRMAAQPFRQPRAGLLSRQIIDVASRTDQRQRTPRV